jgi:hypothetical protein
VLDAKYYKPRGSAKAPANPVKRMLADLHLTGEQHGALLFAFQSGEVPSLSVLDEIDLERESGISSDGFLYAITPDQQAAHATLTMDVDVWRLRPQLAGGTTASEQILSGLLQKAHHALAAPIPIACHGFLPDVDTINPSGTPPMRCPTCGDVMAFCPKPHVHAQRIDQVCPRCDCLRTKRLCHIKDRGTHTAPPFIRRVLTREDLFANIATLRTWLRESVSADSEDPAAEEARGRLLQTIGELTETYVKLTRADTAQTEYTLREWVFGNYWDEAHHARGFPPLVRQMLISGEYVWLQFQSSSVEDWAACAVQYTRALEHEIHRRIYEPCGERLVTREGLPMTSRGFTIGTVINLYIQRTSNTNWQTVLERVAQPSGIDEAIMKQLVKDIEALRLDRNKVAHTEHVNEALARKIRERVLGRQGQPGLLYRLITQLKPPAA